MKALLFLLLFPVRSFSQVLAPGEIARCTNHAKNTTVIRDTWGIPHIYGRTDADAVFGLMYAQCEDDLKRVEMNMLENLGRTSEVVGEKNLYEDLQMRLIYDSVAAMHDYATAPAWFRKLLDAAADGYNYFLYKNPGTRPSVLTRFKPWYSLMRTNGSISATNTGGVTVTETKRFYSGESTGTADNITGNEEKYQDRSGSNGFALAPSKTASGNAILYINPHVTFYYRSEVQMVSDEGLNVYGAVTWGQFFVFQGFNETCGWMHTSGVADLADLYREKITKKGDGVLYTYNNTLRRATSKPVTIWYKTTDGLESKTFTTWYTHHGPVMTSRDGWLSLKENNRSLKGLMQSWLRTKCRGFDDFKKVMEMRANTSDNTVFADNKGHIAYWHGNFIPRRDPRFDWTKPVDGTTSATEWKGIHTLDELVHVYDPATGWIQNCNSTPFTVSGSASPKQIYYPAYMAPDGENPRAINAARLLGSQDRFTLDKMITTGYDTYLSAFEILLPSLFKASEQAVVSREQQEAIDVLKAWDKRSNISSIATTVAIEWSTKLSARLPPPASDEERTNLMGRLKRMVTEVSLPDQMKLFADVLQELDRNFGSWKVKWGDMNRYQRLSGNILPSFDSSRVSFPVGMASSAWGCIPSFSSTKPAGSKFRYGTTGNSFVAAVEFGKKVRARSVVTGGAGMDPSSPHFLDQAPLYINGQFKEVWFYKEDLIKHAERTYHPGSL